MNERLRNMLGRSAIRMAGRWTTVLLTIAAWFLLSNHCALALDPSTLGSDGCPMHSAPAKGKTVPSVPCCKDLRAVAAHATKSFAALAIQLVGVQDYVATVCMPPRLTAQVVAADTGPPRSLSFAESILQRSLLAHAPPAGFPRV